MYHGACCRVSTKYRKSRRSDYRTRQIRLRSSPSTIYALKIDTDARVRSDPAAGLAGIICYYYYYIRDIITNNNSNKYILTALRATCDRWRPSVETERRLLTKWPQHVPIVISETGAPAEICSSTSSCVNIHNSYGILMRLYIMHKMVQ